ncbi:MAG: hypothetical protein E7295_06220 [Lachnospiraceae bacterium]|jgi:hypothetical protein|nr:hypothetical protein [Lachnospiraceae bacterium]
MKIQLAEKIFEIHNRYPYVERQCKNYLVADDIPADLVIQATEEDIHYEREKSEEPKDQFSDAYLESLAVYRKIAEYLPFHQTILFHGSAIAVDGKAYLFTAKSGTGKSTHTRLWREMLGDRAIMVNDDKPLIRITEEAATIFGTPWNGKHQLDTNIAMPLSAICILERAPKNEMVPISFSEALSMLIQQAYRPHDIAGMQKNLSLLALLKNSVRFYRLGCNMEPEAAEVAYRTLTS